MAPFAFLRHAPDWIAIPVPSGTRTQGSPHRDTGLFFEKRHADNAQSLGGLLRGAGYHTAMVGKEHFADWVPEQVYSADGFDDALIYPVSNEHFRRNGD